MMSCNMMLMVGLILCCMLAWGRAAAEVTVEERSRLGVSSQLADNLQQLYPSLLHDVALDNQADVDLQANSPTAMPTLTPAQDAACRLIRSYANQSTEDVCTNCVNAGCKWCTSGDYCFGNLNNNDDCGSYEYGSSIVCTTDLAKLIALLILIIFLSICLPCICIGCLVAVFCFGVNVCFCMNRTNTQPSSTYNQPVQPAYGTAVNNPVVVTPVYYNSAPATVISGVNYAPQPTNNNTNEIPKGVIIGMDSPVVNVEVK